MVGKWFLSKEEEKAEEERKKKKKGGGRMRGLGRRRGGEGTAAGSA